jgi:putative chitinase
MPITEQQLLQLLSSARPVAGIFLPAINRALARYKINSQVRHESGHLRNLVENLNYSAEALMRMWPTRFDAVLAKEYTRQP